MHLTPADRALAASIARAHSLERVRRVQRTGLVKLLGADARISANDEPDLIAADLEFNDDKAERLAALNDERALQLQIAGQYPGGQR